MRAARLPAASADFEGAQTVSDASVQSARPAIGVGSGGAAVITWVQTPDDAINRVLKAAVRSGRAGAFLDVRSIAATGLDIGTVQVAVNAPGDAAVIWDASNGGNSFVQVNDRPRLGEFAISGRTISSNALGESAFEPTVVLDPAGRATALWSAQPSATVQYAERSSSGEWSDPAGASQPGDIGSARSPRSRRTVRSLPRGSRAPSA